MESGIQRSRKECGGMLSDKGYGGSFVHGREKASARAACLFHTAPELAVAQGREGSDVGAVQLDRH
jgi:hypothetical protein